MTKTTKRRELTAREKAAQKNLFKLWTEKKGELGLTQESAADRMGFKTQGAVNQYLNGKIPLNTDAVIKFSTLLGVDPTDIDKEFGQFEFAKAPYAGKSDRLDIHKEIDELPPKQLSKARLLLEFIKFSETEEVSSARKDRKRA
jgi:transcriptional regulator with XRE-family HTH domain